MKKKTLVVCLGLLMILLLSGCKSKVVDEKQILLDISQNSSFLSAYYDFNVKSISASKRQLSNDKNSEIIYAEVQLVSIDDSCAGNLPVILEYGHYDIGWVLDSWTLDESGNKQPFYITNGLCMTSTQIFDYIDAMTGGTTSQCTLEDHYIDSDANYECYTVSAKIGYYHASDTARLNIIIPFLAATGSWDGGYIEYLEQETEWYIAGTYFYSEDPNWNFEDHVDYREDENGNLVRYVKGAYRIDLPFNSPTDYGNQYISVIKTTERSFENILAGRGYGFMGMVTDYIKTYGFKVKFTGDSLGYNQFDYVLINDYDTDYGTPCYSILLVGKNVVAYVYSRDIDVDDYHGTISVPAYILVGNDCKSGRPVYTNTGEAVMTDLTKNNAS